MRRLLALALLVAAWSAHAADAPLKLWHAYRGAEEAALLKATGLFTQKTGVKVELLALPYDAYAAKLTNAIPHGAGPDVFLFNHERLRNFQAQKLVAPTTDRIVRGDYFANTVEALEVEGQLYGYPLSLKSLALYVNTRLVPQPPANTDELLRLLPTLSDAGQGRFGLAYESGDFYYHAAFLFGFDGPLFDASGRASFQTQGMARSLTFVKKLQDAGYIPQEASGALVKSLFNDERAAMVISGPWFAGEVASSVPYRVVALPVVSATGIPMRPFLGVEAAFVSSRAQQPQKAHQLARFLSMGEASRVRATQGRQIPADVAVYQLPEVRDDVLISSFREAARHATPMPNTLEMARVWEPMKLTLRAVLQGGTAPEEAGALADRRYRALHRERPPDASFAPWLGLAGALVLGGGVWVLRRPAAPLPFRQRYPDVARAAAYLAPAAAGLGVLVFIPFAVGLSLSLFHHEAGTYTFVGLANFVDILASRGYRITEPLSFYFTLAVTLLWALVNVVLHVGIGLALALLLKNPLLKLRGLYRVLLIIPWAVPNYITALMWKGMFHRQFGAINGLLVMLGLEPVSWFTRFSTAFAANVATNTWLGFPFMMVVALGALQSIPQELYEAAEVDGASRWTQLRRITLPLLRPAMLPAIILGSVWTFNMFNIIYLVSGGEPGGGTDILVSEAFRWAFQRNEQYGFAAAYSVLIFVVLLGWSAFTRRLTRADAEVTG
ncbi:extracellular solute-binding protein [Myxococcus sp. K15C18031901]|uniref:extracellular solute-binding protein n=1 Tax=Myxococcus dinghuensis TaxID=2906761 RepID=UPI0020A6E962|nr:extracellular solute-binding protein [Myxococcus dinghuensis]MCP3098773.1 extracellular solute-binding protein [Myxococcus dinghuensis]